MVTMASGLAFKRSTVLQQLLKSVIYSKHGIIAINKPYGLTVQGADPAAGFSLTDLLEDFAEAKGLQTKPRLAHRLDRDTTGVLLLARTNNAAEYLGKLFQEKKVQKKYWAVVVGTPRYEQGDIYVPLKEDAVCGRYRIVLEEGDQESNERLSWPAYTKYKVLANNKNTCSLLELCAVTGYKHQLRVHLAKELKTPILGDHKYSAERQQPQVLPLRLLQMLGFQGAANVKGERKKIQPWQRALIPMHLHAKEIKLDELENKAVVINASLPDYFTVTLSSLKLDPDWRQKKVSRQERRHEELRHLGISTSLRSGF